jgi:hypothetical protein
MQNVVLMQDSNDSIRSAGAWVVFPSLPAVHACVTAVCATSRYKVAESAGECVNRHRKTVATNGFPNKSELVYTVIPGNGPRFQSMGQRVIALMSLLREQKDGAEPAATASVGATMGKSACPVPETGRIAERTGWSGGREFELRELHSRKVRRFKVCLEYDVLMLHSRAKATKTAPYLPQGAGDGFMYRNACWPCFLQGRARWAHVAFGLLCEECAPPLVSDPYDHVAQSDAGFELPGPDKIPYLRTELKTAIPSLQLLPFPDEGVGDGWSHAWRASKKFKPRNPTPRCFCTTPITCFYFAQHVDAVGVYFLLGSKCMRRFGNTGFQQQVQDMLREERRQKRLSLCCTMCKALLEKKCEQSPEEKHAQPLTRVPRARTLYFCSKSCANGFKAPNRDPSRAPSYRSRNGDNRPVSGNKRRRKNNYTTIVEAANRDSWLINTNNDDETGEDEASDVASDDFSDTEYQIQALAWLEEDSDECTDVADGRDEGFAIAPISNLYSPPTHRAKHRRIPVSDTDTDTDDAR